MRKKAYQAPVVKKVNLKIKNAILAVCHQSPTIMDPILGDVPCSADTGCYNP